MVAPFMKRKGEKSLCISSEKMNETLHDAVNRTVLDGIYQFGVDIINDPLRTLAAHPVFVILVLLIPTLPFVLKNLFPEQKRVKLCNVE
jgi:hypothetical protein